MEQNNYTALKQSLEHHEKQCEHKYDVLKKENDRNVDSIKEIYKRLSDVEKNQGVTNVNYTNIVDMFKKLEAKIEKIEKTIDEIKEKPAKRWEGLSGTIIAVIVTGIITFILGQLLHNVGG